MSTGLQIGPFTIKKEITQSGCAIIYIAAETSRPERTVILKVAHNKNSNMDILKDLIQNETKALRVLRHPGIVRIYPLVINGYSAYEGRADKLKDNPWYFAMEYIEGGTLKDHMSMIAEKFPLDWRLELFYQLLVIVNFMHNQAVPPDDQGVSQGVAHCDLKPENILFRTRPDIASLPTPVLLDFGTWSQVDRLTSHPAASPLYAGPELQKLINNKLTQQEISNLVPVQFDIWALGAIFFELMTGQGYVRAHTVKGAMTTVLQGVPQTIHEIQPALPDSLDRFLEQMINPDGRMRKSTENLIAALEEKISRPPRVGPVIKTGRLFSR